MSNKTNDKRKAEEEPELDDEQNGHPRTALRVLAEKGYPQEIVDAEIDKPILLSPRKPAPPGGFYAEVSLEYIAALAQQQGYVVTRVFSDIDISGRKMDNRPGLLDLKTAYDRGEFDIALAEGVAFIPGPALSPTGRFTDAFRLCFASTTPERAEEGIIRLRRAIDLELAAVMNGEDA